MPASSSRGGKGNAWVTMSAMALESLSRGMNALRGLIVDRGGL
jgi:hypothetical protein